MRAVVPNRFGIYPSQNALCGRLIPKRGKKSSFWDSPPPEGTPGHINPKTIWNNYSPLTTTTSMRRVKPTRRAMSKGRGTISYVIIKWFCIFAAKNRPFPLSFKVILSLLKVQIYIIDKFYLSCCVFKITCIDNCLPFYRCLNPPGNLLQRLFKFGVVCH